MKKSLILCLIVKNKKRNLNQFNMRKTIILLIVFMVNAMTYAQKKDKTVDTKKAVETKKVVETTKVAAQTPAPVEVPKVAVEAPKVVTPVAPSIWAPKPKNPFEIGISGGLHAVQGDVNSKLGFNLDNSTFGLHIRKALTYNFSMRLQYNYGNATMRHDMPHYSAIPNKVSATNPEWYVSSQTYSHTFTLDQIINFGNNSIHKSNTKVLYEIYAGPALILYRTKLDLTDDKGNAHNWASVTQAYDDAKKSDAISGENSSKDAASKKLDQMLGDAKYETLADNNRVKPNLGGYAIVPGVTAGAAINFLVSEKFSVGLDQRLIFPLDDYFDGERWANFSATSPSYSQNNDVILNTTARLNYFLGAKGDKPLYWQNKDAYMINKMAGMNNKKAIAEAFIDDDGDGIPNILDQELESKSGYPVDSKGIMLDSDKDGFLDADDKEPYSPVGFPIDNKGVAIVPPPACCAEMKKEVVKSNTPSVACAETVLPTVKFAKDKYGVNATMASSLLTIGEKMQACPDMKLVVSGINDKNNKNGKYNEQLSYNRANELVNYLSEKFGLSRDRFITRFNQDGVGDLDADRAVMFRNAQTGEMGVSNPPSPHPGLNAGSR